MSVTNSSDSEKPCVDAHEPQDDGKDDDDDEKKDSSLLSGSGPDKSAIKRVLKEVGLTSTTFIGPEFPTDSAKSNIDDTLEEFYKEIEMIDKPKAAEDNPEKKVDFVQPQPPPLTSTARKCRDRNMGHKDAKPFDNQQHEGRRPSSRPHWYQNEPYFHRGPRDHMDLMHSAASNQSHLDYPEMINRPRDPRDPIPPFHHLTAFPYPQNPSHENYRGGASTKTVPHPHFSSPPNIPPPHGRCHSSQFPFRDFPQDCSFFTHAGDNGNTGPPRFRKQEWCHGYEGYDRGYSRDSETQLWSRHRQTPDDVNGYHSKLVLILMRGLPGSGKSTLAREMIFSCPDGLILSTDDYFAHRDGYCYDPGLLGEAHEWNQTRAGKAMHQGRSPIIIDNTNIQAWEMKPYVSMALDFGYSVDFCEPNTNWKFEPRELEKRNKHGVSQQKISQMMERFTFPVSIDIVMSSQEPRHVNQRTTQQKSDFYYQ